MAQALQDWVGRSIQQTDVVAAAPIRRLAATLGHNGAHWPTDHLPPLGHWLFHLPEAPQGELGSDGHPALGDFLPPVAHPRRMWAGGRLVFHHAIPIGSTLIKRTTVTGIAEKGEAMTFVKLQHELSVDGLLAIEEEQDLVYLPIAAPGAPRPVELPTPTRERSMTSDAVLLFRFSALTFNGHRIHYDQAYSRDVELYPDLVVHGPLQAMLLLDQAVIEGAAPRRFDFRARAPLFVGRRFTLAGVAEEAWVRDETGVVTMTASLA